MRTLGPSEHLSWKELDCKDGTPYPHEWRDTKAVVLAFEFEAVRFEIHRPIKIGSGFRTWTWNKSVGSTAPTHPNGEAIDMWRPKGLTLVSFLDAVIEVANRPRSRIRGIGVYPWGIHIDIRNATRRYRWKGSRVAPEVSRRLGL